MLGCAAWAAGFGSDRRIPAPPIPPYTAAVRVKVNQGSIGCGFLVGPDLMVTAGHVVSDEQGKAYSDVVVECGVTNDKPTHTAGVKEVFVRPSRDLDPASGDDWALVRLDRPIGLYYGWAECQNLSQEELRDLPVELVGFAGVEDEAREEFANFQTAYACPGSLRDVGPNIVFHDCAMWGGGSGSAILASYAGKLRVVAVNTAGVDVQGEVLPNGFRRTYSKELANIAVPVRRFADQYKELYRPSQAKLRRLWIRNNYRDPLRVCVRYRSVLADPKQPFVVTPWQEVSSQKRVSVLEPKSGCADQEVFLSLTNSKGERVGPKASLEFEVEGESRLFLRKYIGDSPEYTATYP
jgi:V8-like Glu-specific endopeptidase